MNLKFPCLFAVVLGTSIGSSALVAATGTEGASFPPANASSTSLPGADQDPAPPGQTISYAYRFIAGSAFHPRESATAVTYKSTGCVSSNGDWLDADVVLPDGAQLLGVRLYYYNNAQPGSIPLFMRAMDGAGNDTLILSATSSLDSGFADEFFAIDAPVTINNESYSYVVRAAPGNGLNMCGARLYYSLP